MSAVLCTQRSEYQDMLHYITQHLVHGALNVFITLKCQTPFRMEWCPYARVCTPSSSIQRLSSSADRQSLDISTVFRTWLVDRKARNLALVVDVVFLRTWRKLVLYVFAFFCNLLPHDRLYIFALRPTNSVGGVEPVSLFILARTRSGFVVNTVKCTLCTLNFQNCEPNCDWLIPFHSLSSRLIVYDLALPERDLTHGFCQFMGICNEPNVNSMSDLFHYLSKSGISVQLCQVRFEVGTCRPWSLDK